MNSNAKCKSSESNVDSKCTINRIAYFTITNYTCACEMPTNVNSGSDWLATCTQASGSIHRIAEVNGGNYLKKNNLKIN